MSYYIKPEIDMLEFSGEDIVCASILDFTLGDDAVDAGSADASSDAVIEKWGELATP